MLSRNHLREGCRPTQSPDFISILTDADRAVIDAISGWRCPMTTGKKI